MSNNPWTIDENNLIVADYFAMLKLDVLGHDYSKTEFRRRLQPKLNGRSEGAIEFKHQNISAVLKILGEAWIVGYKPAYNFQMSLVDAVAHWLTENPKWSSTAFKAFVPSGVREASELWVGPAPTFKNEPEPKELEQTIQISKKYDIAARDQRNKELGDLGEEFVLEFERSKLKNYGRSDLAAKVRWVSKEDGDGAGYDIASYQEDGSARLIEVKTTNGWERTPFHITQNELTVSKHNSDTWCLFRLWNFAREPKAFELRPPLESHISLTPTHYRAGFR
jgi:hypothetical protein